jgi:N-acetylneuraminic acid mutarotase
MRKQATRPVQAHLLRGSTGALLFSCVIVALCSAINLPEQSPKALPPQDNAGFGANTYQNRSLSFADRVAYQRVIEDIYWRHRIWPKERPDPKPALDAVMSQAQLEKKVEAYLRNSQALEDSWQRPLTAEQLQAEMDRMAQHTRQPEVLRELFEALGSDPFVIAECLARPVLSERLESNFNVHDQRFQDELRQRPEADVQAENQMPKLMAAASGSYVLPTILDGPNGCIDDSWTATSTANAPAGRGSHTAVWTGSEMIVWGGRFGFDYLNTGGRYDPATDSWTPTSTTSAPSGRELHTAVWTGSEMIVWGGLAGSGMYFNTGGRYNPTNNTWTATSTTNAPSERIHHTAVWTGSEMIVWSGVDGRGNELKTGGRYNPITDSWTATSTTNAPTGRFGATAAWTRSEMIVWGGIASGISLNTGGRYNPSTDSWATTSTTNAPTGRSSHTAVWTDSEMIVWGGLPYTNAGGRYNPITNSWTATSTTNEPDARSGHTAVWTGSEMIVWGGAFYDGSIHVFNSGGRYNPSTDSWIATTTTNAPEARDGHRAVWTGSEMIVWGGGDVSSLFNTGGRYCAQAGTPTITLSAKGRKVGGINTVRLTWDGATSTDVDVYRNGVVIVTTANDGRYIDSTGDTGRAQYTYKVCEAGTQTCSNEKKLSFQQ